MVLKGLQFRQQAFNVAASKHRCQADLQHFREGKLNAEGTIRSDRCVSSSHERSICEDGLTVSALLFALLLAFGAIAEPVM